MAGMKWRTAGLTVTRYELWTCQRKCLDVAKQRTKMLHLCTRVHCVMTAQGIPCGAIPLRTKHYTGRYTGCNKATRLLTGCQSSEHAPEGPPVIRVSCTCCKKRDCAIMQRRYTHYCGAMAPFMYNLFSRGFPRGRLQFSASGVPTCIGANTIRKCASGHGPRGEFLTRLRARAHHHPHKSAWFENKKGGAV